MENASSNDSTISEKAQRAHQFLEALFGEAQEGLISVIELPGGRSVRYRRSDLDEAAKGACQLQENVYFGLGLLREDFRGRGRGKEVDVIAIPGFWFDLDWQDEVHRQDKLPNNKEAQEFVEDLKYPPTLIVNSGHGFQLYWLFEVPWILEDDEDRQEAKRSSRRFQEAIIAEGRSRGWSFDDTADLSRIFRLPGTENKKREPHVPVRLVKTDGPRHPRRELMAWAAVERAEEPVGAEEAEPARATDPTAVMAPGSPADKVRWTKQVLGHIVNDDRFERSPWVGVAHAIRASCGPGQELEGRQLFLDWSATWTEEEEPDPAEVERVWDTLPRSTDTLGYRRLLHLAGSDYRFPEGHPWHPAAVFGDQEDLSTPEAWHEATIQAVEWAASLAPTDPRFVPAVERSLTMLLDNPSATYREMARALLQHRLYDLLGPGVSRFLSAIELSDSDPDARWFATLKELLEDPELLDSPDCVIPRIAFRGRATLMAGPDKSGKSTLLAHAAARLSRADPFLDGVATGTRGGSTIWVGLEEAVGDAVRRFEELGADGNKINLVCQADGDLLGRLRELIAGWPCDLVVIDSLTEYARITLGTPPKAGDDSAWATVVRPLVAVARDHDVAVVILHHSRKSDGQYRGSTEIAAAMDALLELSPPKAGEDPRLRRITGRGRMGMSVEPFDVILTDERYEIAVGDGLSLDAQTLAHIRNNPGITKRKLRELVSVRYKTLSAVLGRLMRQRLVEDRGDSNGSALHLCATAGESFDEVSSSGTDLSDLVSQGDGHLTSTTPQEGHVAVQA